MLGFYNFDAQSHPWFSILFYAAKSTGILAARHDKLCRDATKECTRSMIVGLIDYINSEEMLLKGHSVSTQPIFAKVPRCPSPILPKKFLKLLWLV